MNSFDGNKNTKALILDWPGCLKGCLQNLKRSLPELGIQVKTVIREKDWHGQILRELRDDCPDFFFTFQRLYRPDRGIRQALRDAKIKTVFLDFGVVGWGGKHYGQITGDPVGEGAESEIAALGMDTILANPHWQELASQQLGNVERLRQEAKSAAENVSLSDLPKSYWLLLLQRSGEMLLRFDSEFTDSYRLAKEVVALSHSFGPNEFVVVKPHPLDKQWKMPPNPHGPQHLVWQRTALGEENDKALLRLIGRCKALLVVNSTTLFTAMLFNKPILQLGRGWCANSDVTKQARVNGALFKERLPAVDWERRRWFMALMLARQIAESDLADPAKTQAFIECFYPDAFQIIPQVSETVAQESADSRWLWVCGEAIPLDAEIRSRTEYLMALMPGHVAAISIAATRKPGAAAEFWGQRGLWQIESPLNSATLWRRDALHELANRSRSLGEQKRIVLAWDAS